MNQKPFLDSISRLKAHASSDKLTEFEFGNLVHELQEIEARLVAGQYKHSDCISRNTYDVPRRTQEYLIYMQGFHEVSLTWAEILRPIISQKTKNVLDLCPGWAPKIELALHKLDFNGTVFLWDVDSTSTKRVLEYMSLFRIDFDISQIKTDLFASNAGIKSDVILANHIIDDLLLYEYCKENHLELSALYESEEKMLTAVTSIMGTPGIQQKMVTKLIEVVETNLVDDGYFIISQYAGLFEKANNLTHWVSFCKEILHAIKGELIKKNYTDSTATVGKKLSESGKLFFNGDDMVCLKRFRKRYKK